MLDITEYPGPLKAKLGVFYRAILLKILLIAEIYLWWDFTDDMGRSNSFLEVLHTFNRQMQNPTYKKNLPTSCQDMNFCLISANAKSMQQVVLHRVTLLHPNRMDPKIPIQVPSFFFKAPLQL